MSIIQISDSIKFFLALIIIFQFGCNKSQPSSTTLVVNQKWMVSTFAGSSSGYLDSIGIYAKFNGPHGLAIDSKGNLYVGDMGNFDIRKIDSTGRVTTFEGTNVTPSIFWNDMYGMATDQLDNLYIVAYQKVYKIVAQKNVSIFVGGATNFSDGQGINAGFNFLSDLAIASNGNIYLGDYNKAIIKCLRMITPASDVSTINLIDNTGLDDSTGFLYITPIAIDQKGNIYITGKDNNLIKKIDSHGVVSVFAGQNSGFKDGQGTNASFNKITGLVTDNLGNVYVLDLRNYSIRKVTPDGLVSTIAGNGASGFADGDGSAAMFSNMWGIVIDRKGAIYVSDFGNNKIRKIEYK